MNSVTWKITFHYNFYFSVRQIITVLRKLTYKVKIANEKAKLPKNKKVRRLEVKYRVLLWVIAVVV